MYEEKGEYILPTKGGESKSRLSESRALWGVDNAAMSESRKNFWRHSQVFAGYLRRDATLLEYL